MNRERIIEVSIIAIGLVMALLLSITYVGKMFDLKLYDIYSRIMPRPHEWNKIVYVNIDDQSIDLIGRWPWPRYEEAKGIAVMKEFGAEKILFDIEFIDKSRDVINYDNYVDMIQDEDELARQFGDVIDEIIIQPDNELLRSMAIGGTTNIYLACRGVDESKKERADIEDDEFQEIRKIADSFFIPLKDKSLTNYLPVDKYLEFPAFPLYMYAKGLGFTTTSAADSEIDAAVRKIHLFRIFDNYLVPQLSLPMLLDDLNIKRDEIEIIPGKYVKLVTGDDKVIKIPITMNGEMYINWSKKWREEPFKPHISYGALIEYDNNKKAYQYYLAVIEHPQVSEEEKELYRAALPQIQSNLTRLSEKLSYLKGKIIIIGNSATSTTDVGAITIDSEAPLVLLQGNVLNTIYQGKFLQKASPLYSWGLTLLLIAILFFAGIRFKSATSEIAVSGILILVLLVAHYFFLATFGYILNYGFSIFATIITFVGMTMFKYIQYDKQKNQIKSAFMHYLSPDIVKELIDNPDLLKLGGERREITAYFSDVQGFTTISEGLSPEELVHLLNEYLTAMSDIIMKHGGTVDKYEGDAIIAFFGAPIPHKDHAIRCCNATLEMQKTLITLRKKWKGEGFPEMNVRMGFNTGQAIVGNMGSQQRMDYTMMGDTVNLAARLEGANKAYGTYTMFAQNTHAYVKDRFIIRRLDLLQVVGKKEPIKVYELLEKVGEAPTEMLSLVERYNEALVEYEARNWVKAHSLFKAIYNEFQDIASKVYAARCVRFNRNPPPTDWNGVFVLKSK